MKCPPPVKLVRAEDDDHGDLGDDGDNGYDGDEGDEGDDGDGIHPKYLRRFYL